MRSRESPHPVSTWLLLLAATACSLVIGEALVVPLGRYAGAVVIAIAFLKVRWVGLDFMELRRAPRPLRRMFEAWSLLICATLIVLYLT